MVELELAEDEGLDEEGKGLLFADGVEEGGGGVTDGAEVDLG